MEDQGNPRYPTTQEIVQVLNTLKEEKKNKNIQLATIKSQLNAMKSNLQFNEINKEIKRLRDELYYAMKAEGIDKFEGYDVSKLVPLEEKKQLKEEQKKQAFLETLHPEIPNQQKLGAVVEKLTSIKV